MAGTDHNGIRFSGIKGNPWLGAWCQNRSHNTITKGMVVYLFGGGGSSVPYIPVQMYIHPVPELVLGFVVHGGTRGDDVGIAFGGYITNLLAWGTVSPGDWLCMTGNSQGAVRCATTGDPRCWRFARACSAHAGNASPITALVLPWRI